MSPKNRAAVCEVLNATLADMTDLASHCRHVHWNTRGRSFMTYHKLFELLTDMVREPLDEIAERITALGGFAQGTVQRAAAATNLKDLPDSFDDPLKAVAALADSVANCAGRVRASIDIAAEKHDDAGSADLLTAISRSLDKGLWLLDAHGA